MAIIDVIDFFLATELKFRLKLLSVSKGCGNLDRVKDHRRLVVKM